VVQTLVFILLSMIYIGLATAGGHDDHHEAGHDAHKAAAHA
jgi:hypothetical protein